MQGLAVTHQRRHCLRQWHLAKHRTSASILHVSHELFSVLIMHECRNLVYLDDLAMATALAMAMVAPSTCLAFIFVSALPQSDLVDVVLCTFV